MGMITTIHHLLHLLTKQTGRLRLDVTLKSGFHLHGLESPSGKLTTPPEPHIQPLAHHQLTHLYQTAKAPLPHHHRLDHHLRHPLLLRHGNR
jgi:hypothetical protein